MAKLVLRDRVAVGSRSLDVDAELRAVEHDRAAHRRQPEQPGHVDAELGPRLRERRKRRRSRDLDRAGPTPRSRARSDRRSADRRRTCRRRAPSRRRAADPARRAALAGTRSDCRCRSSAARARPDIAPTRNPVGDAGGRVDDERCLRERARGIGRRRFGVAAAAGEHDDHPRAHRCTEPRRAVRATNVCVTRAPAI